MITVRVRVGVIGTGLMGSLHAQNLAFHIEGAELVAVCDIDAQAAEVCAERCRLDAVYRDCESLLGHRGLDAVLVCTPPEMHGEMIAAAAHAGKHVLCEKPIECDLAKIDAALEAVAMAGVKLQLGFNRRFDRRFNRAREAVAQGEIGRPLMLHIISRDPVRAADEEATFTPEMFLDTTIHDLDMARFVMGSEIVSVSALGVPPEGGGDTPVTALTTVRYLSGAVGVIDNSWLSSYGYDQRLEVFGTEGIASVENESSQEGAPGERAEERAPFFVRRYFDSYIAEIAAFVACIQQDSEPVVTGADGRAATALALAARRSLWEGRPVPVSEIG